MTLRVEKAGRVVRAKRVRDRLGLRAGSDPEIEEAPEGVVLKSTGRIPSLVRKGSFLVHTGEIPAGFDITGSRRFTMIGKSEPASLRAREVVICSRNCAQYWT